MQYATPQFIEQESKIIFFLTFRQFFWLVGAGGLCILWYYILPFFFFALASLLTAGLVAVIAFVKVNNMSALQLFFSFLNFNMGTKNYTWKKKEVAYPFKVQKKPEPEATKNELVAAPKTTGPSKLNDIRKLIDTRR